MTPFLQRRQSSSQWLRGRLQTAPRVRPHSVATIMLGTLACSFASAQPVAMAASSAYEPSAYSDMTAANSDTDRGFSSGDFNNSGFDNSSFNSSAFNSATTNRDSANALRIPDLSRQGVSFADQHQNRMVGEWSLQQLNNEVIALNDPWVQTVMHDLTWQLNAQVRQQAPLALVVVNDPSINAFAIPGGVIGLHTGTITSAKSMDEVASVLAHEVAHLSQRHYEHSSEARRNALLLQIGGLLAAIAASSAGGDAATAIMMGSQTVALDSQMAFSRSNEREADRVGMQIMTQAGFDPKAMPRFFATMNARSQLNQVDKVFLPSFIRSHPLSNERLSEAQSRAQQFPAVPLNRQLRHEALFDLLYWRVQLLSKQANEPTLQTAAKHSVGATLALSHWHASQQRYEAATKTLAPLLQKSASEQAALEPLLSITRSEIASAKGDWQQAADILQAQQRLYPERRDLRVYLAEALITLGQAQEAQTLLKPLIQQQESDLQAWQGLQKANDYLAKHTADAKLAQIATINALRYRGQTELWRGRYSDALVSLTQGLSVAKQAKQPSLIAAIDNEIAKTKIARDFKP